VKLQQGTGDYLIDTDGDGNWDMTVDPASGEAKQYTEQSMLLYAGIILVILIVLFIGVYLIVRRRRSRIISKSQSTDNQKKP
jgi:flagellar biosynthesis/type III secretory pathway M-ring protein FliF/YscJ